MVRVQKGDYTPGDSKWPFHPIVGGHLTIEKGHLTIPKRSQRIARLLYYIPGRWFQIFSLFSALPGEDEPNLTSIFVQLGWFNHQPDSFCKYVHIPGTCMSSIFGASTFQNRPNIKHNSWVIWVPGIRDCCDTKSYPLQTPVFNQPGFSSEFLMPLILCRASLPMPGQHYYPVRRAQWGVPSLCRFGFYCVKKRHVRWWFQVDRYICWIFTLKD